LALETEPSFYGSHEVARAITGVTESMSLLRGKKIIEGAIFADCRNKMDELEATGIFQAAFKPVFRKVKEEINKFTEKDSMNFIPAVKWYLNHKMFPQALTMMQEGLLTLLMDEKHIDYQIKKNRENYSAFLQYLAHIKDPNSKPLSKDQREQFKKWGLDFKDKLSVEASYIYYDISQLRNDINHCGFEENAVKYENIVNKIKILFERMEKLCQKFFAS